jgi:hypothetical protein
MKPHYSLFIAAALLLLAGCTTPYQSQGVTGGFTDIKIDANTWRVKFDGNGYTPKEMVWNYWIYRCAALTIEKGFSALTIESAKNATPPKSGLDRPLDRQSPVASNGAPAMKYMALAANEKWSMVKGPYLPSADDRQNYEKTKGGGTYYYYVPGGSYTVTTWHSDGIVHMFNENSVPPDVPGWLRAATIVELLKPYVDSGGKALAPSREYIIGKAMVRTNPAKMY